MKNLFDIFREKLAAKEYGNKDKHWKELEKRLNANDATKGGAWFPAGIVFSVLIGLGAFVLLFPVFMNDENKTFYNPLNSNTDLVIAQNESKLEAVSSNKESQAVQTTENTTPEPLAPLTNFENPRVADASLASENYFRNKNASFIRLSAPDYSAGMNENEEANQTTPSPKASGTAGTGSGAGLVNNDTEITTEEANTNLAGSSNNLQETSTELNNINPVVLEGISSLPLFLLAATTPEYQSLLPFKKEVPDYFPKSSLSFKAGVYAGFQYTQSILNESAINNAGLADRLKMEENGMLSPVAGFDIQVGKKGWSLSTGLNYYQQGEQRNYSDDFLQTKGLDSVYYTPINKRIVSFDTTLVPVIHQQNAWVVTDTLVTYYNEASGTFVTANLPMVVMVNNGTDTTYNVVVDSVFTNIIDSVRNGLWISRDFRGGNEEYASLLKGKNTYTYFEIPLMLGYDWRIRNWSIGIKAGLGFGILTKQTAYYLSIDERKIEPYLIEQSNKLVYNLILRPDFSYWLGKNWGISGSPFLRMNLNNFNQNPSLRSNYRNFGFQAGINYRW